MRLFVLLLFVGSMLVPGKAKGQYSVKNFTTEELPSVEELHFVSMCPNGFYWISTIEGLIRFDGKSGKRLVVKDPNSPIVHGHKFQSPLKSDSEGNLWFTTYTALHRFDPVANLFTTYQLSAFGQQLIENYRLIDVSPTEDLIFLRAGDFLFHFDPKTQQAEQLSGKVRGAAFAFSKNKKLGIGINWNSEIEIFRKDEVSGSYNRVIRELDGPVNSIVTGYHQNDFYCGTDNGIVRIELLEENIDTQSITLTGRAMHLALDQENKLIWYYQEGKGIAAFDLEQRTGKLLLTERNGLLSNHPNKIEIDREGNIWAAHQGLGLDLITRSTNPFTLLRIPEKEMVSDLLPAGENTLTLLTKGGKYLQVDGAGDTLRYLSNSAGVPVPLPLENGKLARNRSGEWINGIEAMVFRPGVAHPWRTIPRKKSTITNCTRLGDYIVTSLDSAVVALDMSGSELTNQAVQGLPAAGKLAYTNIFSLTDSTCFVGYQAFTLCPLSLQKGRIVAGPPLRLPVEVNTVVQSGDKIYLGTNSGLWVPRNDTSAIQLLAEVGGHGELIIESILPDKEGMLWLGTQRGLVKFDPVTNETIYLDRAAGLPAIRFIDASPQLLDNGRLVMATDKGLLNFHPDSVTPVCRTLNPYVAELWINEQPQEVTEVISKDRGIERTYQENTISLKVGLLGLDDGAVVGVRSQLRDYDPLPIYTERNGILRFRSLPPGDYELDLTAVNSQGRESGTLTVPISISPPFWQTWLFRGLLLLAGLLIALSIYTYLIRRERLKQTIIQEQQARIAAERDRIAGEVHDDLGGQLSSIMYLTEELLLTNASPATEPELLRINQLSRNSLQNVRDIIFALDNRRSTLGDLSTQLIAAGEEFFRDYGINFIYEEDIALPDYVLTSRQKRNLGHVIKEAWHNTVKHAQARTVRLTITSSLTNLHISISDDGIGLSTPAEAPSTGGYGLDNMRDKIEAIGGAFALTSFPRQGTSITIQFPTPPKD